MQQTKMNAKFWYLRKAGALMALCAALLPDASFAATDTALLPRNLSPWGMFLNADIVVKAVMIGLALASLVTWTVWLAKTIELRRATAAAKRRLRCSKATPRWRMSSVIAAMAATPSRRSFGPPRARQVSPTALSMTA